MFRFSRDKRFFRRVSFTEFAGAAAALVATTKATRPNVTVEVLTCEDAKTHKYSRVTFVADEVTEALKERRSYTLKEFTEEVWKRSLSAQLTLKDDTDPKPFMICLSLDKQSDPRSMKFYGQSVEQELVDPICDAFARPSSVYKIGDGYSKRSAFNVGFGRRLMDMNFP